MISTQRSWQQTTTDVAFLCVGVGVFWIPYVLFWFDLSSLVLWFSTIFFLLSIYVAGIAMVRLARRSHHSAGSVAVVLNVVGIVIFPFFAAKCWIEPALADEPGASGGANMVWGITALPILLGFFVLDLSWFLTECVRYFKKRTFRFGWAFLVILTIWVGAFYYDNIHHGI